MKRLGLALCLLLLIGPLSLAQDEQPNTGPDPDVKLLNLYALEGRSWSLKEILWIRGSDPLVTRHDWKVKNVEGGTAEVASNWRSTDGSRSGGSARTVNLSEPSENDKRWAGKQLPEVELDMGFRKFRCKKLVSNTDDRQETTWVSVEYHPLAVKQVIIDKKSVTVSKLTAFLDAPADPWLLYRKQGRRWKLRNSYDMAGMMSDSTTQFEVKQVREDGVTYTLSVLDDKGNVMFSDDQEMEFPKAVYEDESYASQPEMELKTCPAGEFLCYRIKLGGVESWTSVHWPGLQVASKMESIESELIEFDIGHDEHAFYRTKGNYYVTRGAKGETTRVEVTEVSETEAGYSVTITSAEGKPVSTETLKHAFPTEEAARPYSGEQEQVVSTEAGSYPAVRTVAEDGTESWSWNGITILAKSQETGTGGAGSHTIELIELKME
ncbi:MAG: hypothetical protein H6841_05010 [Planctomycetes bacterium]|nr:hypothetical protein [Planctomycetota bacterium]